MFLKSWLKEKKMLVKEEFYTRKLIVCGANEMIYFNSYGISLSLKSLQSVFIKM
jgi:hypothetical protein